MARAHVALAVIIQSFWCLFAHQLPESAYIETETNRHKREDKTVCYPVVGCFNNSAPFDNTGEVPSKPEDIGTKFLLFTRRNRDVPQEVLYNDGGASLRRSYFNKDLPVKFVTHGFTDSSEEKWIKPLRDALLNVDSMNVIIVDWENGAKAPNYPRAASNTRIVGIQIGLLVNVMVKKIGSSYDKIHLTGHSLGAHISGYAGSYLKGKIARITGLDPAGPFFESYPPVVRLDKADAKFVDVIHSNGARVSSVGAGLKLISGHVDFYPNGGAFQPGCETPITSSLGQIITGNVQGAGAAISCSHSRSHQFFTESIQSACPFTSYPCTDWDAFARGECLDCSLGHCSQMGYYADHYAATGRMFLKTLASSPYCGFHYRVALTIAEDNHGQVKIRIVGERGMTDIIELSSKTTKLDSGAPLQGVVIARQELGNIKDVQVFYDKQESLLWGFVAGGTDSLKLKSSTISGGEYKQTWTLNADQTEVPDDAWFSIATKRTITIKGGGALIG